MQKNTTKISAIILCIVLLFNSFFYCISLNFSIIEAKSDAREKLSEQSKIQDLTLIKISSKEAKETEENELWYNNKLYDIAKIAVTNDTVYYYVLEDEKEEQAISLIHEHFSEEYNLLNPHTFKFTFHKITTKGIEQLYCFNSFGYKLYLNFLFFDYNKTSNTYTSGIEKVLTPPPKIV